MAEISHFQRRRGPALCRVDLLPEGATPSGDPEVFQLHLHPENVFSTFATQVAANGATEWAIMNQTGHKSPKMLQGYIHEGSLFRENAAGRLGL